ncbi:MAG TPA: fasciclin domain-containing protein, partial [Candidatus Obscuribacterales bacterium]
KEIVMQLSPFTRMSVVALAATMAFAGSVQSSEAAQTKTQAMGVGRAKDIVSTAQSAGDFKTLVTALKKTGLDRTLKGKGPYTVFAPSDAAFAKMPRAQREELLNDKKALPNILKYHVVPKKKYMASDLAERRALPTAEGEFLMLVNKDGITVVDGAIVTKPDINCSNGVIHVIDDVVIPARGK